VVRTENDLGKIFLREGNIVFASINDAPHLPPMKCVCRILAWRHGTFYMEPPGEQEFPADFIQSAESVLMESMRILDEVNRQGTQLPPMNSIVSLAKPLRAKLQDLNAEELDVLQCAINFSVTESVFNNCATDDIQIAQIMVGLIQKGYLNVERNEQ